MYNTEETEVTKIVTKKIKEMEASMQLTISRMVFGWRCRVCDKDLAGETNVIYPEGYERICSLKCKEQHEIDRLKVLM